jgi:hypothetical protein
MLQYALCAAFFVLGFVARDLMVGLLSKRTLKRMNRRMKRGGVNNSGNSRAVLKPRPPDAPRTPGASERAVSLFGAPEVDHAQTPAQTIGATALDPSSVQPR